MWHAGFGPGAAQKLGQTFSAVGTGGSLPCVYEGDGRRAKTGRSLGLLTSNRFLFIRSGVSLRRLLRTEFDLDAIYDLGDTKLFSAAVLPVIIVARKRKTQSLRNCAFHRIYECRRASQEPLRLNIDMPLSFHALRDENLPD